MPCYTPPWEGSPEEAADMFKRYGLRMSEKNLMQALLCEACSHLELNGHINPISPLGRWWGAHQKKDALRKLEEHIKDGKTHNS